MDERLIEYIISQRKNGFSDDDIKSVLKKNGYPDSLIKHAFLLSNKKEFDLLKKKIKDLKANNFSDEEITKALINEGYSLKIINKALTKKNNFLIFFFLAIIIISLGLFFMLNNNNKEPVLVEESLSNLNFSDKLIITSQKNPELAISLCEHVIEKDQSRCFLLVAKNANRPDFCKLITDVSLRDDCYLKFIYDGAYDYCDLISLDFNKEYCDIVKENLRKNSS